VSTKSFGVGGFRRGQLVDKIIQYGFDASSEGYGLINATRLSN
jgi:hypothetical protein